MRDVLVAVLSIGLASCCSVNPTYDISFLENASRLYIEDGDGDFAIPTGRAVFGMDNQIYVGKGYLLIQPGKHAITHACANLPAGIYGMSGAQSAVYTFEPGKDYVVRCMDGFVTIASKPVSRDEP